MAGNKLSGYAAVIGPSIPMTLWSFFDTGPFTITIGSVWVMTQFPGQDPVSVSGGFDAASDDDVMDAVISPSGTRIVYATTPIGAGASTLRLLDPVTPNHTGTGTIIDTNPSALVVSMQPAWHPSDNDLVVYRTMDDSPNECQIRSVVPSVGVSSVVTLRTLSRATGDVYRPSFNHDGTLIAYAMTTEKKLYVMAADGSGSPTLVATLAGATDWQGGWDYAWSPVANELAYQDIAAGETVIKKVNSDGTGTTTLFTDPSSPWWGLTLYPWSSDGTTLFYFVRDLGVDPRFRLYAVDSGGGGGAPLAPNRTTYGGTNDHLAYVFGSRIYWFEDQFVTGGDVVSCAFDGSDLRTEFTTDNVTPSSTIASFVSGFYYRLNQAS